MKVLEVENINKSFGKFQAVKDLSFSLEESVMLGLLGPNGAGKTTTIRMIMNIIMPDSGTINILGRDSTRSDNNVIGYLPEERGLYRKMKVNETLIFLSRLKSVNKREAQEQINYWFDRLEMSDWKNKKLEELSKGMQQKVLFVANIVHKPKMLIIDEPFMGLDPINTNVIKNILLELKEKGTTIIFSTHLMEHAEKLCDEILLINKGQGILFGSLQEIKRNFGRLSTQIEYEGDDGFLENNDFIKQYDNYGQYVEVQLKENADPHEFLKMAVDRVRIKRFEVVEPSLNEIFIETVNKMDKGN